MSFLELAKKRCSIRKFKKDKVEKEKIDQILEAGRLAPTAVNKQPQRIVVIDNLQVAEKLKEVTPYTFSAPIFIVVCYDKTACWVRPYDEHLSGEVDASIAATHMMLMIKEIGLDTTWVGHFEPDKLAKLLELGENMVPVALFPVGYAAEDAKPSHLHEKRLPIEELVRYK